MKEEEYFLPGVFKEYSALVISSLAILLFVAAHYPITQNDYFRAAVLPTVLVDETNENRVALQTIPLAINPLLVEAAQRKANDMAAKSYFSHISPEGRTPWSWMKEVGYSFNYAGENLAIGFFESSEVTRAWLESPLHRQNILNGRFTEIGIATAQGFYQGVETTFVVQMFGSPKPLAAKPTILPFSQLDKKITSAPAQVNGLETEEESIVPEQNNLSIQTQKLERYSSRLARWISAPRATANILYMLLAAMIFFGLINSIFREVGRHHPKHIALSLFTLTLLMSLVYLNRAIIFSDILII